MTFTQKIILIALLVLGGLCLIVPGRLFFDPSLSSLLIGGVLFAYTYLFLFYMADWIDNGIPFRFRTIPMMIAGNAANLIVGAYNQIGGLIRWKDQQHWVKTEHAIGAETVQERQEPQLRRKAA